MSARPEIILKDGRVFCVKHQKPWKQCPCDGEARTQYQLTQEVITSVTPKADAFSQAAEAALGEVRDLPSSS